MDSSTPTLNFITLYRIAYTVRVALYWCWRRKVGDMMSSTKFCFQIDALSSASDWLIFKKRWFCLSRVPPSEHQFENHSFMILAWIVFLSNLSVSVDDDFFYIFPSIHLFPFPALDIDLSSLEMLQFDFIKMKIK